MGGEKGGRRREVGREVGEGEEGLEMGDGG